MSDRSTKRSSVRAAVAMPLALFAWGCGSAESPQPSEPAAGQTAPVRLLDGGVPPQPVAAEPVDGQRRRALRGYLAWDMHESATIALGRIGAAAVPDLVRALRDPDPGVRLRAAEALARIGPDAKEAVPELIRLLSDEREHVETRKAAAWALGQIGPPASGAVPELMRILQAPPTDTPQADAPNRGG